MSRAYCLQLDPTLPVEVVGRGAGQAVGWIDYGPEHDLLWIVWLDESRECWVVPTPEIRAPRNWSMGRRGPGTALAPAHSTGGDDANGARAAAPGDGAQPRRSQAGSVRHPE